MGQNGRWRTAMVDHIVADRPGAGARRGLGDRRGGPPARRPDARPGGRGRPHPGHAPPGSGERGRSRPGRTGSSWSRAGPSRLPFADGTFDALTFTYLLALRRRPPGHPDRAGPGGQARWGGGQPRVPPPAEPVLAILVVGLHPARPPGRRLGHRRAGVVRGGPVPRSQHLGPLPALPAGRGRSRPGAGPASTTSASGA